MPRLVTKWDMADRSTLSGLKLGVFRSGESAHSCLEFMDAIGEKIRRKGFAAFITTEDSDLRPRRKLPNSHKKK